jgi:flagellin
MSSLLTNAAALTALASLNMTQQNLATTQGQISTGLKVANASDNAAYWSIAQNLQSNTSILGAVNSSIAQSQSVLGAATAAINTVLTTINSITTALTSATQPAADLTQINTTLAQLGQQLSSAVAGASFNGLNLLDGSQAGAALSFVSGYNVSSTGAATFNSVSLTTQALTGAGGVASTTVQPNITNATTIGQIAAMATTTNALAYGQDVITAAGGSIIDQSMSLAGVTTTKTYAALDANGNATTLALAKSLSVTVVTTPPGGLLTSGAADLTNLVASATNAATLIAAAKTAFSAVTSYASIIGSAQNALTEATTFNTALSTNYTTGIGALVDADMNQASTRLQALQTQQQLGVQSLSIANQSSQLILKLFQ